MTDDWQKRPRLPKNNTLPTGVSQWYSRGYVLHFDMPGLTQTMTFRLFDSMPQAVLELWREELRRLPEKQSDLERRKRIDAYLDQGHECNRVLTRKGEFWQREPFDRYIRNEQHYENAVSYIEHNPVKAGLCDKPEDWRWSSAYLRAHLGAHPGAQASLPADPAEDPS